jgi:uncharacterized protein (TIGR02145 family)
MCLLLITSCEKDKKNGDNGDGSGIVFNSSKTYGTVTDYDGNVYKTIMIGSQKWMAENLKTEHYSNGDIINHISDPGPWENAAEGAWTYYSNNADMNKDYGKLYSWYAVSDPRNICPNGWHMPSDAEWEALLSNLGGYLVAGAKMRETGTNHYAYSNDGATNESGFTGLPGGMKDYGSANFDKGMSGYFWSADDANDYYDLDAHYYFLSRDMDETLDGYGDKNNGISCRCVENNN